MRPSPGTDYTYTIIALKGTPGDLVPLAAAKIVITTESPEGGNHDVYFNRGVAASQEYVRRFGDRAPDKVAERPGLHLAVARPVRGDGGFVESCDPGRHALRIAAYEFHYAPFLDVLKAALDAGVDIKIVYDARREPPRDDNRAAPGQVAGLDAVCTERTANASAIAHNKFIVKLEDGQPVAVWTGGTNFSDGGIFGHRNVAHVVEEPAVAAQISRLLDRAPEEPGPSNALRPSRRSS